MSFLRKGMIAAATGAAVLTGGVVLSSGSASAKTIDLTGTPLLDTCPGSGKKTSYTADRCDFTPTGAESFQTDFYLPQGDEYAWNCTSAVQDHQYQITDVHEQTNSIGFELGVGGTLFKIIEAKASAQYGHTWTHATWQWSGNTSHIQPGRVGWLELSTEMLKITGKWQINFGDRVKFNDVDDGAPHYEWYIEPYSQTDAKENGKRSVAFKERDMTDEEKSRICGSNGQGPGERKRTVKPGEEGAPNPGLVITPAPATKPVLR
ncbi:MULTISPECIES: hypothetical protein [Thermomonosporaceae]|uniref:hypothetical protein n=1 Tax=Thermomonosporaceae TaxID=2012 RepID=UPI00255A8FFD|nr:MULTISPECIES: hypothetical protein [Thermomonosporaceae]MDL4771855.1 hypothetical protein [Actinomadura xylanilytica]